MEVIVSTIIIALTVTGMANLFMGGKRWVLHSRTRMVGGEVGRIFLDPLQMDVNQGDWNDSTSDYNAPNRLRLRTETTPTDYATINGRPYQSQFSVENVPGDPTRVPGVHGGQMRKVTVDITWPGAAESNP